MKTLIKIFISMVCGAAVFALCTLVNIWCGTSAACRAEMFVYLFLAFYGLIIFVVVLILQLNKVKMKFIIGVTLFSIVIYSIVPLVNRIKSEYDWYISKKESEVENPWKTTDQETLLARLQAGENIDKTNKKGQTLLHYAADIGDLDLMKFAIENGADVNKKDEKGYPAARYAVYTNWTLLEYLADNGADLTKIEIYSEPLIVYAAQNADAEVISMLLKYGANVHAVDLSGRTPLFRVKTLEVAQVLMDAGADVNFKSNDDLFFTPIFQFRYGSDDLEILKMLIEAGADIEVRNEYGNTPLLAAAEIDYAREAALILINSGANIHVKNKMNDTPLLLAAAATTPYSNNIELLKTLVERGADKTAIGSKGKTAYQIALDNGLKAEEIEFLKP